MDISVAEYAAMHKRDRSLILRLIRKGRIKARKSGGIYLIEQNTPYPEDRRRKKE